VIDVLHAFIDESEHRDEYFTLTALIVTEENLPHLERELHVLLAQYAITTQQVAISAEFHGYDIMQQKCDWDGVPLKIATSIYLKALGIINRWASAMFVETIDRRAQERKYRYVYNARTVAISYILERVNTYALMHNDTAKCYLDDHYTAPEGPKEFIEYKATGTFGYKSSKLANIDELEFYDSKDERGLQAADLCCYVYQRHIHVKTGNEKMLKTQAKMWGAINDIAQSGKQRIWP